MQRGAFVGALFRPLILSAAAFFCLNSATEAATNVSGPITTNTTWTKAQSPYEVTADVSIESGATLTIEPGVTVYFGPNANLLVRLAALKAQGTSAAPIVFTSINEAAASPAPGDWGQVRFLGGTFDASTILDHVDVRFGQGISIQSASPTLNYLIIANHAGPAVSIDLDSSPAGVGNKASGNGINGVVVPAGDIVGSVSWKLKGIPYVVPQGIVSIGQSPALYGVSPTQIQQGETLDVMFTGSRLTGVETVSFSNPGVTATLLAGATATSVPVRLTAASNAALGLAAAEVQVTAGKVTLANALNVIAPKPPIVVSATSPASIRRSETRSFQVTGENLNGATVTTAAAGLTISNVQSTATQMTFTLSASLTATLGSQTFTFLNPAVANGSATVQVDVLKEPVKVSTTPAPIAVPPDKVQRQIKVRLSEPDTVAHDFIVTIANTTIAQVSPASFSIPAGATEAAVGITGLKAGETTLTLSSPTLTTVTVPLVVTAEYINFAYTSSLGVTVDSQNQLNLTSNTPLLGVVVEAGSTQSQATHTALLGVVVETDSQNQLNLSSNTPLLGVTVETDSTQGQSSSSHTSLLGVTVETSASSSSASVMTGELGVVLGSVAFSISPTSVVGGSSTTLVIYGDKLDQVTGVSFYPSGLITVGSPLQASADGKSISVPITVGQVSATTTRQVVLTTASGKVLFADPAAGQLLITVNPSSPQ